MRFEAALRSGFAAPGVPEALYLDNGTPFVSGQLLRACASLRIRLIHSRPGRPEGRGKIEPVFRTVRDHFLVEAAHAELADLVALNRLFAPWVETTYHRAVHSKTGEAPLTPAQLHGPGLPKLGRGAR